MDSSPRTKASEPSLPPIAGVKRPAASLLPAFEPLSSSPGLPRPSKRQARSGSVGSNAYTKYPTPVPTSSTGILSSSPPRVGLRIGAGAEPRPGLQRTQSIVSERAPLCAVPSIELNENGETLLMGRSSSSSQYQLSANRQISRVHVKARYVPATTPLETNKIEVICNGWNGLTVHCQGRTWDLRKGDTFFSETEGAELMIDVQDARVRIQWPRRMDRNESPANLSDSSWDDSPRPRTTSRVTPGAPGLQCSPLRRTTRIGSPDSPTPAGLPTASSVTLNALLADPTGEDAAGDQIQIYEDASADEQELPPHPEQESLDVGASFATEVTNSFSSDLSDLQSDDDDDPENDPNEENDPIVHSFGPFGANLSNRLASFSTLSPNLSRGPTSRRPPSRNKSSPSAPDAAASATGALSSALPSKAKDTSQEPSDGSSAEITEATVAAKFNVATIRNHLINQLAFSRLSSSPLSTIMNNLPAEERRDLARDELRVIIEGTTCVGVIPRQGKDAAGKPLESEYYYMPEMDDDESRRAAVVDGLRKPSLRNCRKQHKQYYWKRPRTP